MAQIQSRAIVVGNGFVKMAYYRGGRLTLDGFPSVIASEESLVDFDGLNPGADLILEMDGARWVIGEAALRKSRTPQTMMGRDRIDTDFFRILFAAALSVCCPNSGPVSVALSLPLTWYKKRDSVKEKLEGVYDLCIDGKPRRYEVTGMRVVPEGFGTLCSMVMLSDGNIKADAEMITESTVGIVEIGTYTTDVPYFDALRLVEKKSDTIRAGLMNVWLEVQREIRDQYGQDFELHEIDRIIQDGHFYQGSTPVDIQPMSSRAFSRLADKIRIEIGQLWSAGHAVRTMPLSGGGSMEKYGMKELLGFSNATPVSYADEAIDKIARHKPWAADVIGALLWKRLKDAQEGLGE